MGTRRAGAKRAALTPNSVASDPRLDLNRASEDQIARLPGVGLILAKKTLQIRRRNGSFRSVEDFLDTLGIRPHLRARLVGQITVSPPEPAAERFTVASPTRGQDAMAPPSPLDDTAPFVEVDRVEGIYAGREVQDAASLALVRRRISEWASGIPHHDFTDLGDHVRILSIREIPSYFVFITTLYESREIERKERPHRGESIPRRTVTGDAPDPWSLSAEAPEGFQAKRETYTIDGSQEVVPCTGCKETGQVTCVPCNGLGNPICGNCRGAGLVTATFRCSSCGGSGSVMSTMIMPSLQMGLVSNPCGVCGGAGRVPGTDRCSKCNATGSVTCGACSGKGVLTCATCVGQKQMLRYLALKQTFEPVTGESLLCASKEVGKHLLARRPTSSSGSRVFQQMGSRLSPADFERIPLEPIRAEIARLLEEANPKDSKESPSSGPRIFRQRVSVFRIRTVCVRYGFQEHDHTLWLYGPRDTVFSEGGPVWQTRDEYLQSSQRHLAGGRYSRAHEMVCKAVEMDPAHAVSVRLKEEVCCKISTQYRVAGLVSGAVSGLGIGVAGLPHGLSGIFGGLLLGLVAGFASGFGCAYLFRRGRLDCTDRLAQAGTSAAGVTVFFGFLTRTVW